MPSTSVRHGPPSSPGVRWPFEPRSTIAPPAARLKLERPLKRGCGCDCLLGEGKSRLAIVWGFRDLLRVDDIAAGDRFAIGLSRPGVRLDLLRSGACRREVCPVVRGMAPGGERPRVASARATGNVRATEGRRHAVRDRPQQRPLPRRPVLRLGRRPAGVQRAPGGRCRVPVALTRADHLPAAARASAGSIATDGGSASSPSDAARHTPTPAMTGGPRGFAACVVDGPRRTSGSRELRRRTESHACPNDAWRPG